MIRITLFLTTLLLATTLQAQTVVNDLPALQIKGLDGKQYSAKSLKGKTVIVMYQPDCDHCQREAAQLQQNIASFKNYQVYFITNATPEEIKKFSVDYKLNTQANVHFGITSVSDILKSYGSIETPSLYIYAANGKLVKKFNGEADIQEVKKHL